MKYIIYTNKNNPHSTIHINGCVEIKKRGGEHKYNQGDYFECDTLEDAEEYCEQREQDNESNIIYCSHCNN